MEGPRLHIAIFASGKGTNAERIIRYFRGRPEVNIGLIVTNDPSAGVLDVAKFEEVPFKVFQTDELKEGTPVLQVLREKNIDLIILAGFLLLLPPPLVKAYSGRILNLHPSLLPKFGGKGMYGDKVHKAVIDSGEKKTGITIHEVNEEYDQGKILFQESCPVFPGDTPTKLAERVQELEHEHFPKTIDEFIQTQFRAFKSKE